MGQKECSSNKVGDACQLLTKDLDVGNKEGRHNKTELPTGSILAVQMESQNNEDNKIIHERIVLNSYNCHGGILYTYTQVIPF